jgi:hypothetical protein
MKPQTQQPEPLRPPVVVPGAFTDPVPMPEIEEEDNYENKLHQPAGPQIEDRLEMPLRKEAEPAPEPTPAPQPERPTHMNAAQIEAQTREPLSMAKRELARCEGEVSKSRAEYQAKKAALEEAQKTIAANSRRSIGTRRLAKLNRTSSSASVNWRASPRRRTYRALARR